MPKPQKVFRENRQKQTCALCRNHKIEVLKRGHFSCPHETEKHMSECLDCQVSKQRRRNGALEISRKRMQIKSQKVVEEAKINRKLRKSQKCRKCRNHNLLIKISNHHRAECQFINCDCELCMQTDNLKEAIKIESKLRRKLKSLSSSQDTTKMIESPDSGFTEDENCDDVLNLDRIQPSYITVDEACLENLEFFNCGDKMEFDVYLQPKIEK